MIATSNGTFLLRKIMVRATVRVRAIRAIRVRVRGNPKSNSNPNSPNSPNSPNPSPNHNFSWGGGG